MARNWSLGGFLLDCAPALDAGGRIKGRLRVAGRDGENLSRTSLAQAITPRRQGRNPGLPLRRSVSPGPWSTPSMPRWPLSSGGAVPAARRWARRFSGQLSGGYALGQAGSRPAMAASCFPAARRAALEFHLDFPDFADPSRSVFRVPGRSANLADVAGPERHPVRVLAAPRASAMSTDSTTGTSRSYAGPVGGTCSSISGFFGNLSLAGSWTRPGILARMG